MDSKDIEGTVLDAFVEVSGFGRSILAEHQNDDLIGDLGLDSIKLMEAWAKIETACGIGLGELAITRPNSLRAVLNCIETAARE